ncbi:MAG TPA: hypothetical protein VM869_29895 [Enhygromyxa sp.]|nr:hypothetical protein [Enhygromyxa sp.]
MDDLVRALLAESAAIGRTPLDRPTPAPPERRVSPRELIERLDAQLDPQQRNFLEALVAAVRPSGDAQSLLPTPPPSIHEGGFRIYPTPSEPAFGNCGVTDPPCSTHYVGVPGHFGALAYLRGTRGTPRRLLIAVHGSDLPGWRTHPARAMYGRAATLADHIWGDDYAIVAPALQRTAFKPYSLLTPWVWYWSGGWGYGNRPARFNPCHFLIESAGLSCAEAEQQQIPGELPIGGYTGRPSSFEVLDELIRQELALLGASLEYVCLVGHSHGGQAVQRYALLDRGVSDEVLRATGRPLRYVAMNAGAYAYLIAKRWITPPARPINCRPAIADNPEPAFWTIPVCEGYDDWPLGLSNAEQAEQSGVPLEAARRFAIARYGLREDASLRTALAHNFAHKDVHVLQSALDRAPGPGATCGPQQQGCSRLERMRLFRESLLIDTPDELHEATVAVVRNCRVIDAAHPHSSATMFRAAAVRDIISGRG